MSTELDRLTDDLARVTRERDIANARRELAMDQAADYRESRDEWESWGKAEIARLTAERDEAQTELGFVTTELTLARRDLGFIAEQAAIAQKRRDIRRPRETSP